MGYLWVPVVAFIVLFVAVAMVRGDGNDSGGDFCETLTYPETRGLSEYDARLAVDAYEAAASACGEYGQDEPYFER